MGQSAEVVIFSRKGVGNPNHPVSCEPLRKDFQSSTTTVVDITDRYKKPPSTSVPVIPPRTRGWVDGGPNNTAA